MNILEPISGEQDQVNKTILIIDLTIKCFNQSIRLFTNTKNCEKTNSDFVCHVLLLI